MVEEKKVENKTTQPKVAEKKVESQPKNIRQKLQEARMMLKEKGLKPSGYNEFTKSSYFGLSDILPSITEVCATLGICPLFSYANDVTTLTLYNVDDSEDMLVCTSPQVETEVKISKAGKEVSSKMQALAGNQTSAKRMLLLSTFDICNEDEEEKEVDPNVHNIFVIKDRIFTKVSTLMKNGFSLDQISKGMGLKDEKQFNTYIGFLDTISKMEGNINVLINDPSKIEG